MDFESAAAPPSKPGRGTLAAFAPLSVAEQALVDEADGGSFDNLIAEASAPEDDPRFCLPDMRMPVGQVAKGVDYGLTISGWVLGLLAVAALSGLVRSR